ncbi:unnamed protein product [Miscanthus lutarioriparius]|uniref:Uncharacterized protein n=1 Tax=Miscanthus lutarioriparius TaxID=422564 RepID=A0A811SCD3_9POAL|nr:unnamed protein product [Miscanthus lutarioriparius]
MTSQVPASILARGDAEGDGGRTKVAHFVFVPLREQGHLIPAVDTALLLATHGALCTIVALVRQTVESAQRTGLPVRLVEFPLDYAESGLPEEADDADRVPPNYMWNYYRAMALLRAPIESYLRAHAPYPTCIVSDFVHPWTTELAANLGVPRLSFFSMCAFSLLCQHNLERWVNSSRLLCCFLKKGSNVSVSFHNSRLKSSGKNTRQLAKLTIGRNLELRKDEDGRGVSPEELRKDWRSVLQAMAVIQGSRLGEATGDADAPMAAVQTQRGDGIGDRWLVDHPNHPLGPPMAREKVRGDEGVGPGASSGGSQSRGGKSSRTTSSTRAEADGVIVNTVLDLEPEYVTGYAAAREMKVWTQDMIFFEPEQLLDQTRTTVST